MKPFSLALRRSPPGCSKPNRLVRERLPCSIPGLLGAAALASLCCPRASGVQAVVHRTERRPAWPVASSRRPRPPRATVEITGALEVNAVVDREGCMAAVDAWQGLPAGPMRWRWPTIWAGATTSTLRMMANVGSVLCHVTDGLGATRLRCLIVGHDDRFSRESGRLSLRCEECGRSTAGWTIGSAGPREVSRLPSSSGLR
jgi:hypothetical protein